MGRVDLDVVAQRKELVVQRIEQHPGQLLRCQIRRQIGTAYIADEQGVAGEHGQRLHATVQVRNHDRDALHRMAGSFQKTQDDAAETNLIAVVNRHVREASPG